MLTKLATMFFLLKKRLQVSITAIYKTLMVTPAGDENVQLGLKSGKMIAIISPLTVFLKNLHASSLIVPLAIALFIFSPKNVFSEEQQSAFGITNFAFSNYLGTGFYATSGQEVFVFQIPFQYTIREKTNKISGWVLKLPLTFGIINVNNIDINNIPDLNDVTTLTFLPGIEYQHPITQNWTVTPFIDIGLARDFNNATNVLLTGIGIKSFYSIPVGNALLMLGNRFLYARERSDISNNDSDYSLIETGLNYRVASDYTFDNGTIFSNLYYINFYYPNNLVFFEQTANPVRVGVEHEIGITFSNLPDFLFFKQPQIGAGIRFGDDLNVFRIVFGAPF